MDSVFAYVCTQENLDPSEGIELSGQGVIAEVEKLKDDEMKEITRKIKEANALAKAAEKEVAFDDDPSEDWVPKRGSKKEWHAIVKIVYVFCFFIVCVKGVTNFFFQGNSRVRLVQQVKEKMSKENAYSLSNHLRWLWCRETTMHYWMQGWKVHEHCHL